MTSTDKLKLCRRLAEAEGWQAIQIIRGRVAGIPPLGLDTKYPNAGVKVYIGADSHCLRFATYLAGPETVRMQIALHEAGLTLRHSFTTNRHKDSGIYYIDNYLSFLAELGKIYEIAVAQAYLTMLEEQQ